MHFRMATALVIVSVLGLTASATAASERPFNADLVGAFAFGPCPAGAPTGARCLHDRVSGPISYLGQSTGEFDVVLDVAATGPDGCAPAHKRGFFVATDGDQLQITADGRFCFATTATTYTYTLAGGTGRFADASGTGSWLVPAPRTFDGTKGEGDEQLRGTITFTEPEPTTQPATQSPAAQSPAPCRSRRTVVFNLRRLPGRVLGGEVRIDGRRVTTIAAGSRRAIVDLRGRPRGSYRYDVRWRLRRPGGSIIRRSRNGSLRTCQPRPAG